MNCQKVKYILRGLSEKEHLETLDFSHCKIGDDGAASIAKFITRSDNLRNLKIADNIFGNICIGFCKSNLKIKDKINVVVIIYLRLL